MMSGNNKARKARSWTRQVPFGGTPQTSAWVDITGKPATFPATIGAGATDAVAGDDPRLTDARTPTAHVHPISDVTNLQSSLDGKEPANANIQAHVTSAHAPANAQKNSDILKAEIEAVLTGVIASHSHAGAAGSGDVNRLVATGTTRTIADRYSLVAVDYIAVEGTGILAIEGDGALAIL